MAALALLASASMWFYVDYILVPYQIRDAAQQGRPRGNLSDLYPRWLGARELLLRGRDPYSPDVTREIQAGYYGRALEPARAGDPQDQQAFAYPVYVVFLLAPTVRLPFHVVQHGFDVLLWILTGGSVLLWLSALRWRAAAPVVAAVLILTLGSIPAVQGIKLQQLSLLVAGLLAASAALLVRGSLVPAGILLAVCTIKPQLAGLPALWLLLWAAHDWRRRQRLVWSFSLTMLVLLVGAELILTGWLGRFWAAIQNYHQYTHNTSVLGWLLSPSLGSLAGVALLVAGAVWCWPALSKPADSPQFGTALALMTTLMVLIVPMFAPYNQVFLLPALIVLARDFPVLGSRRRLYRFLCGITALAFFWPWAASIALMFLSFLLPATTVQQAWKVPFFSTFTIPVFVFALISLHAANVLAKQPTPGGSATSA